jgi:hypothetical protein
MLEQVKPALAVVLVAVLAWVLYAQVSGGALISGGDGLEIPAELEIGDLEDLREVASVSPVPLLGGSPTYSLGGRNLFQYGRAKPPPPSPEELERRRRAEEERLKRMEEEARRRKEDEERRRRQQAEAQKALDALNRKNRPAKAKAKAPVPQEPKREPPPPISLKLVGYLGPAESRIAVFIKDKGKEVVLGKKGEVIEGKFRLLELGAESVEMGYVDPQHADSSKIIQLGS